MRVRPGETAKASVVIENRLPQVESLHLRLDHSDVASSWSSDIVIPANDVARVEMSFAVSDKLTPGRYVVPLVIASQDVEDGGDSFVVLEMRAAD